MGIVLSEVDHLITLRCDRHAGNDGVVVAGHQVWNDAVPVVDNPFAGQHGPRAELITQFTLEAVNFASIVDEVIGGVGPFGAHPDCIGKRHASGQRQCGGGQDQLIHMYLPKICG